LKKIVIVFTIILAPLATLIAQTVNTDPAREGKALAGTPGDEPVLIWSDEFDGTGIPDPGKWDRPEYNRRPNSKGPDGFWSRDDSYLDGKGNLIIRVRKIDDNNNDGDSCDYSVGAVRTLGKYEQLYGRFEIRCQLPTQPGWWVAFWMMQGNVGSVVNGGVDGSEVDIMEAFGWTDKINHAVHYDGYGTAHKSVGKNEIIPGIRNGFHTYTLEWYPEMYVWFVDGEEKWRSTGGGVCNQPGYIKITGEISTEDWAINNYWSNDPAKATYPDSFVVDYVRVYEVGEYVPPASVSSKYQDKDFQLVPNPADEWITLDGSGDISGTGRLDIRILNSTGQVAKWFDNVQRSARLSVSDLSPGLYLLIVQSDDSSCNLKFIKD
jgi:beta-glucanase (GH16 family)